MKPYYRDRYATLYHGDCRDVLSVLKPRSIDLLLSDPPYGMAFKSTAGHTVRGDGRGHGPRLVRQMLGAVEPKLTPNAHLYLCCHWESWPEFYDATSCYAKLRSALIWWKNRGGMGNLQLEYARDYEVVLFASLGRRALAGRRDGAVISGIAPVSNARVHPTEKPVALMSYLISKSSKPGMLVVDPFCGSGATLVAAKQGKRRVIGVELEERYCEAAARRLEAL